MRALFKAPLLATLVAAGPTAAQEPAQRPENPENGIHLTIFRSPATGLELRNGHFGAHAGYYPTILSRNGEHDNVGFIRLGGTYYGRSSGSTLYITPSVVISMEQNWKHGALTELGYRATLYRTLHARIGAAVLTTTDREVRVNPTVGMDLRIGRTR